LRKGPADPPPALLHDKALIRLRLVPVAARHLSVTSGEIALF
jgi:hypothetical protein